MMTDWYDKTIQALQLNGKGDARSVRMLTQFYGKNPDLITEQELQDYFLKHVLPTGFMKIGITAS